MSDHDLNKRERRALRHLAEGISTLDSLPERRREKFLRLGLVPAVVVEAWEEVQRAREHYRTTIVKFKDSWPEEIWDFQIDLSDLDKPEAEGVEGSHHEHER